MSGKVEAQPQLDLAIIGSGPAALSAAIYAARAGLKVTVFERGKFGGALSEISHIANYPGFVEVTGQELAENLQKQAAAAGAKIEYGECTKVEAIGSGRERYFRLTIDEEPVETRAVLIATGSEPRPLGFELKVPVSYCSLCDADFAKGKNIAVVGGGNSAVQETLYLAPLVKSATIISHSALKANQCLITKLQDCTNVTICEHVEPTAELLNQYEYVFVFIGKRPATSFLEPSLLDEAGYVAAETGNSTKVPGLFAAGDVRSGAVRQIVTAAGDGAAAAIAAVEYLK